MNSIALQIHDWKQKNALKEHQIHHGKLKLKANLNFKRKKFAVCFERCCSSARDKIVHRAIRTRRGMCQVMWEEISPTLQSISEQIAGELIERVHFMIHKWFYKLYYAPSLLCNSLQWDCYELCSALFHWSRVFSLQHGIKLISVCDNNHI